MEYTFLPHAGNVEKEDYRLPVLEPGLKSMKRGGGDFETASISKPGLLVNGASRSGC